MAIRAGTTSRGRSRRGIHAVVGLLVVLTIVAAPAPASALPEWGTAYDWQAGDGSSGWLQGVAGGPGAYSFTSALPGLPGLWVWPAGGDYSPGRAAWTYTAPGTTRIAQARLVLRYPSRVASLHCVDAWLQGAGGRPDFHEACKPAGPLDGVTTTTVVLADPAATATTVSAGLTLPCDKPNAAACDKHIPVTAAERNGLQVAHASLTLVDDDLPTVTATGPFARLAGRYIDGREAYALTLSGVDAGAGIRGLALERAGGSDVAVVPAPCDPHHLTPPLGARVCPPAFSSTVSVDSTRLPEGRSRFTPRGTDPAGNTGRSAPWDVIVDRSAPTAASEFEASVDTAEGVTYLDWISGQDPVLADGTPGSGVAAERFRFKPIGGSWSAWRDVTDGQAETAPLRIGEQIVLESYAVDRVGNRSPVARGRTTVEPASSFNDDYEAVYEDQDTIAGARFSARLAAPADLETMDAAASSGRRKCAMSGIPPRLTSEGDEPNVNVYTFGNFGCPVGDFRFQYMQVTACLDFKADNGDWHQVGACESDRRHAPQPPVYGVVNQLCRPGTHDYRVRLYAKVALSLVRDIHISHTLDADGRLNCNEAGAWRTEASFGISSPSAVLGANLRRAKDLPPTPRGFQAHHIVPASYATRAARAQRFAYDCGFPPNGEPNGVWLRGPSLRKRGEAGATHSTAAYRRLPPDGKRRAYHPTIHTRHHFDWIAGLLDAVVHGNDQCRQPAGDATLRSVKEALLYNVAKYKPEDNGQVSPQD